MKRAALSLLCWCSVAFSAGVPPLGGEEDSAWTFVHGTDDGITVTSREVQGSGIRELKARCRVSVPPDKVFHVAMSRETYRQTSGYVVEYRVMPTDDKNVWYTYQRLSFPLVNDRDYTLRYEARKDSAGQGYSITWTIANEMGPPPQEDVVRVEVSRGSLEILPLEEGKSTDLSCTLFADPGGIIPGWLVNIANRSTVPDLLRAIRDSSVVQDSTAAGRP